MIEIITILAILLVLIMSFSLVKRQKNILRLSKTDRQFLLAEVPFYASLTSHEKLRFEKDVLKFLNTTSITGVRTKVTMADRLLVASSAVIPLFGFPDWEYSYLDQVLLYPGPFDRNFNFDDPKEIITGMVGSGQMEGIMILSKPALHAGFTIDNDRRNVGIHEFVHLYDKEDGKIDGIPPVFAKNEFGAPWIEMIREKTRDIIRKNSDIDNYGATAPEEFFAVAAEYFYEKPHLLLKKHPKLYQALSEVFRQDPVKVLPARKRRKKEIGRNSPCPCGSGKKFKRCCIA